MAFEMENAPDPQHNMNLPAPDHLSMDEIDEILARQEEQLSAMKEETELLFDSLDIEPQKLREFLHDRERFSHEAWDAMQQQYHELKELLEEHLQQRGTSSRPSSGQKDTDKDKRRANAMRPKGHWIFVR